MKKGILTFYIDIHTELNQDAQQIIDTFVKINQQVLDKIATTGDYAVMFVPTTKEACRVDKIDFDKPFPRFAPKVNSEDRRSSEPKNREGNK